MVHEGSARWFTRVQHGGSAQRFAMVHDEGFEVRHFAAASLSQHNTACLVQSGGA